jgi:hypothetical protein
MVTRTDWWLFEPPTRVRRENLEQRIALFRSLVLGYVPNIFRYATERTTYEAVSDARGLSRRRETLLERFERYEKLVGDAWDLGSAAAGRRINRLIIVLTGLSFISAVADFRQVLAFDPLARAVSLSALALALLAIAVVGLLPSMVVQRRRARRALARRRGDPPRS